MKKISLWTLLAVVLTVFLTTPAWAVNYSSAKFANPSLIQSQYAAGSSAKVIVTLDESGLSPSTVNWTNKTSAQTFRNGIQAAQASVLSTLAPSEYTIKYQYLNIGAMSLSVTEDGLTKLLDNPAVRTIQPVQAVCKMTAQGLPLMNAIATRATYGGSGVAIAIVDDAIDYTHPDLGGGGFPNAKVIGGYDFGNNDPDPAPVLPGDAQAHGTSVSGVAAGSRTVLMGDYIGGAAPDAKIYALKFSNDVDGGLTNDGGIASWDWCITHQYDDPQNPILVISNSWGAAVHTDNEAYADQINPAAALAAARCVAAGMTVVVASGNEYSKNGLSLPAANSNTVAVGAVYDTTGQVTPYSNSGNLLDLLAPADCTYTTDIVGAAGYGTGNWQICFNGTSCATPYVSGMIAILQQASMARQGRYLTPAEALTYLTENGTATVDVGNNITKPLVDLKKAFDAIPLTLDSKTPTPDPMAWEIQPVAVGLQTIYMQAVEASDISRVEYFFDCNVDAFDSGWQSSPIYYRGGYTAGTAYQFRVKARDKSTNQNETAFSVMVETTTASGSDTLPPAPSPAMWKGSPRKITSTRIAMEGLGYDDATLTGGKWVSGPLQYFYKCVSTTDPAYSGNPSVLDSGWTATSLYQRSGLSSTAPGNEYVFQVKVRDAAGNETNWSSEAEVLLAPPPIVRIVPTTQYPTIQTALDAANHGDTVLLRPGVYTGAIDTAAIQRNYNLSFGGKKITLRSEDPDNPNIVASTIIDCAATLVVGILDFGKPRRAFVFDGEGRDTVVAGITVMNAYALNGPLTLWKKDQTPAATLPPQINIADPAASSTFLPPDGRDALGGAIYSEGASSPTIRNCVFKNCAAIGSFGADGAHGNPALVTMPGQDGLPGGPGGNGGLAYGGAMYFGTGSAPLIKETQFIGCFAMGGMGGEGGDGCDGLPGYDRLDAADGADGEDGPDGPNGQDGGSGAHGGDGGYGGNAWGGAAYFEADCLPEFYDVTISECFVKISEPGSGGNGSNGADGSNAGAGGAGGAGIDDGPGGNGGDGGAGGKGGAAGVGGEAGDLLTNELIAGAIYFAGVDEETEDGPSGVTMVRVNIDHCRTDADLYAPALLARGKSPQWYATQNPEELLFFEIDPDDGSYTWYYDYDALYTGGAGGNGGNGGGGADGGALGTGNPDGIDGAPGAGGPGGKGGNGGAAWNTGYWWYIISMGANIEGEGVWSRGGNGGTGGDGGDGAGVAPGRIGGKGGNAGKGGNGGTEAGAVGGIGVGGNDISMNGAYPVPGVPLVMPMAGYSNLHGLRTFAGGNYYGLETTVTETDCVFEANTAITDDGGGEYFAGSNTGLYTGCTFMDNTTYWYNDNGEFYQRDSQQVIFEGTGGGPGRGGRGGGVFAEAPVRFDYTDCTVNRNESTNGGGLYLGAVTEGVTLTGCSFTENAANARYQSSWAGAVYVGSFESSNEVLDGEDLAHILTVTDSVFEQNIAPFGGAICTDATYLTVTESEFNANVAEYGAGIYSNASDTWVQDVTFYQNSGRGTEPHITPQHNPYPEYPNPYCSGAGLYSANSSLNVINAAFLDNDVVGFGGATEIAGAAQNYTMQRFVNCLFADNSAGLEGGAVSAILASEVELVNSTFVDNIAEDTQLGSGGALQCYDAFVDVYNSIFWGNLAVFGPQISVGEPFEFVQSYDPYYIPYSTVFVDYSDIQGGEEVAFVGDGDAPWLWYGPGNIEDDPLFAAISEPADSLERTFYLSELDAGQLVQSPCVNAGFGNVAALAAMLGFDITTRTDHVADTDPIDMGYHYDAAKPHGRTYELTLVVDRGSENPEDTKLRGFVVKGPNPFDVQTYDGDGDLTPYRVTVTAAAGARVSLALNDDHNPFYQVKAWHGTDDDGSMAETNWVTMTSAKEVVLELDTTRPTLTVSIGAGNGTVTPMGKTDWAVGTVVNLQATPANISDSVRWKGTDDDTLLTTTNTVTMTESKDVEVSFYTPTIRNVSGDFTELQYAIDASQNDDIIILHPGIYEPVQLLHFVFDKNIRIQGYNPDDPDTVANTVIRGCPFIMVGTDRTMILNGITLEESHRAGDDGCDGTEAGTICEPYEDGGNGDSIAGGAIEFIDTASATVKNCRFVNCSVAGGNGGDGTALGDGGWGGWARGGAVSVGEGGNPRFINCEFIGNSVRGGGGGDSGDGDISGRGGSWEDPLDPWLGWDFGPYRYYWKYSGYGGAVYCSQNSKPEFTNCLFSDNIVYGGHTGMGDGLGGYPFAYYKIDRYGGAIFAAQGTKPVFTRCIFEDNQADLEGPLENYKEANRVPMVQEDPYLAYGGTIAFGDDAVVTLKDCVIENGLAHHGGGIYAEHATLTVSDSNFVGNTAAFGGAVYYVDTETTVDRTIFRDNSVNLNASQGGAVFAFGSPSTFTDVVVSNNTSGRSGGGFFVVDGQTTVKNALIVNNKAVRDGAGFSANWYANVDLQNCTFSLNEVQGTAGGISQGGGVYVGYQSDVDIIDSILWANSAGKGQQIAIGTGFEFDPVPSKVTISHSDVQGNRSAASVFVDTACTLNWDDASMLYADPLFMGDGSGGVNDYYLSQPSVEDPLADTSPAVDTGSALANTLGLDKYTTAYPIPKFDFGLVDMGYHYPFENSTNYCAYADLGLYDDPLGYQLDGIVELKDLMILAYYWLETQCDQTNQWCYGADLNFYNGVDFYDYVLMASCWQVEDIETPTPNPSQWAVAPKPTDGTLNSVTMEAVQAADNWIGGVEYKFENLTNPSHSTKWRQSFDPDRVGPDTEYVYSETDETIRAWIYEDSGLQPEQAYTYMVKVRDVKGNETAPSTAVSAIPGEDLNPPQPDPSQWAVNGQPRQTNATSVTMQAVQAVDAEGYGVEYLFVCVENGAFSSGWQQNSNPGDARYTATPWIYNVTGLTVGQTYTFYVKTRDRSVAQNETEPSVSVAVTMAEIDALPPYPTGGAQGDPALHAGIPVSFADGIVYYQIVSATVGIDPSGVEYKFVCNTGSYSSGGSNGPEWRNANNVGVGTANPTYFDGSTQVPQVYVVRTGTNQPGLLWWIYYRDLSPNQNTSGSSIGWAVNGTTAAPKPNL